MIIMYSNTHVRRNPCCKGDNLREICIIKEDIPEKGLYQCKVCKSVWLCDVNS
jgi:hypothetical protein